MADKKIRFCESRFPHQCSGCKVCELICSFNHTRTFNPALARIRVAVDEADLRDFPIFCRQCDTPACEAACPTGANRTGALGTRRIDEALCTGCGDCAAACPYDGIRIPPGERFPIACDLCGGEPGCAPLCPRGVLSFAALDPRERS